MWIFVHMWADSDQETEERRRFCVYILTTLSSAHLHLPLTHNAYQKKKVSLPFLANEDIYTLVYT